VPDLAGSLGGGGRYDGLIGMFSGEQIPACGFSLGLERILVVMGERGMFPPEVQVSGPDVLVTGHYGERFAQGMLNQADHRAVGLACVDAVADAGNRWIFPELVDEGFEPWSVRRLCFAGSPTATHYVDVGEQFERAVQSLEAHRAYNEALPDDFPKPRELVSMILDGGGQAAGFEKALVLDVIQRG